jgi:uncharacterized protein YjbI with pentapeptide repeats
MSNQGPELINAEENSWYRLATLYGLPKNTSDPIQVQNRNAWNRYVATLKSDEIKTILITDGTATQPQIVNPYDPTELLEFRRLFAARSGQSAISLPELPMDFSGLQIKYPFLAKGYLFTGTVRFDRTEFSEFADFEGSSFESDVQFAATIFHREADFTDAAIDGKFLFAGARFGAEADFVRTRFLNGADFSKTRFGNYANFTWSHFEGSADFSWATFAQAFFNCTKIQGDVDFARTRFMGSAFFVRTNITGDVDFSFVEFEDAAQFTDAELQQHIICNEATFGGVTDFKNVKFQQPASFRKALFCALPPQFDGATLHEGTDWEDVYWPGPPKSFDDARASLKAYERLKLEMDKLKKHEAELDFFARELQCRRILNGYFGGLPIASYGAICDYGVTMQGQLLALSSSGSSARWLH